VSVQNCTPSKPSTEVAYACQDGFDKAACISSTRHWRARF
jgi:hypothetical protein